MNKKKDEIGIAFMVAEPDPDMAINSMGPRQPQTSVGPRQPAPAAPIKPVAPPPKKE